MKFVLVAASSLLAVASPAFAHGSDTANTVNSVRESAETPAEPAATGTGDGERLVCRRIEADTSSRLGNRRVCMTADQWRQRQRHPNG